VGRVVPTQDQEAHRRSLRQKAGSADSGIACRSGFPDARCAYIVEITIASALDFGGGSVLSAIREKPRGTSTSSEMGNGPSRLNGRCVEASATRRSLYTLCGGSATNVRRSTPACFARNPI